MEQNWKSARILFVLLYGVLASASALAWQPASYPGEATDYRPELNVVERHYYNGVRPGRDPWIAEGLAQQAQRIRNGMHTGRISPQEAHWLWREHRDIREAERWAMGDGMLTPDEREHLRYHLMRANRHIVRAWQDWERPY